MIGFGRLAAADMSVACIGHYGCTTAPPSIKWPDYPVEEAGSKLNEETVPRAYI
jgi:hypothetical protein